MSQLWAGACWTSPDRRAAVAEALSRLDRSALHPETIPIFDALYHLKDAMEAQEVSEARAQLKALSALTEGSRHPDRERLSGLIARFDGTVAEVGIPELPTLEETLETLGVAVIDGDLPEALRRFLARERDLRRALEDRTRELEARYATAARASSLMSLISVLLFGLLLATGAVALDLVQVDWMAPASLDDGGVHSLDPANTQGSAR